MIIARILTEYDFVVVFVHSTYNNGLAEQIFLRSFLFGLCRHEIVGHFLFLIFGFIFFD